MAWSKASRQSRGYGADWERVREKVLKRDRYVCQCERCKAAKRTLDATHVDHVISKANWKARMGNLDGCDDPSNLRAINADCHKLKTILEKGHQTTFGCDANGLPTDPDHPWNRK